MDYIILFIIILIFILLGISIYKNISRCLYVKTGGLDIDVDVENVLIVDVANMYIGWYMEKYKKETPYNQQPKVIEGYIDCMKDHYDKFLDKNNNKAVVNYIIKNYKYSLGEKKGLSVPLISKDIWNKLYAFIKERPYAHITVAEDYIQIPYSIWKLPRMHYMRGRDDYLCFKMAQYYKKKYIKAVIMSDDKYKDYTHFGMVPEFLATYIYTKWDKNEPVVLQTSACIKPTLGDLGQIQDYKTVKITLEFNFEDPKFLKTSEYKVAKPGHVWD